MKNENRVWKWFSHGILILMSLACILPFVLLIVSSLTDESVVLQNGYTLFPKELSLDAYLYLWNMRESIFSAYGISIIVTTLGTFLSLVLTTLLAYPLSRKDLPCRNIFGFIVFFTILFNGGLVPTYLVYSQLLDVKNTIWALIVPTFLMSGFYVLLMRTFFQNSVPDSLLESAKIDGAGEWRILWSIVLPLSTPILATIGLFQAVLYWNDWMNGLIYLTDTRLYSIQVLLNRILEDIQYLRNADLGGRGSEAVADLPGASIRMAIAAIGVIPMLIAYPFFQKYLKRGIALGGIKG